MLSLSCECDPGHIGKSGVHMKLSRGLRLNLDLPVTVVSFGLPADPASTIERFVSTRLLLTVNSKLFLCCKFAVVCQSAHVSE